MWGIIIWFISFHDGIKYFLTYFWYNLIPARKKGKIPSIMIAFVFPRLEIKLSILRTASLNCHEVSVG
jgi:hypothetical protein